VSLPDGRELGLVKLAMSKFGGEGRVYTGASVTCGELTCKQECEELMQCSTSVGLTVPAVLASLRQFIVELRRGEGDLSRFFEERGSRSTAAGSASSGGPSSSG